MSKRKGGTVPSKQWSCSELKDGQQALLAVKSEGEEDLEEKIKERKLVNREGLVKLFQGEHS